MNEFSDLRLLNVFTTVFKQRSISGASRILNVSQPSVSRSIHNLESTLGIKLFKRSSDGLIPTDFSCNLYSRALSIIDEVDSIYTDAENFSSVNRTLINVGLGSGCCLTLENSISEYIKMNKEIVFNTKIASARSLVGDSENRLLDIIIGYEVTLSGANWLTKHHYLKQKRYLIARNNHPVFEKPFQKQMKEILKYPEVTYHLLENSHGTKSPLAPTIRMNDYLMLFHNVSQSDTYLAIHEELLVFIDRFNLSVVGNSEFDELDFVIAYNKENLSKESEAFIEYLRNRI